MKYFILLISFFILFPGTILALSSSENYQLEIESINIAGDSSSENYQSKESVGGQPLESSQSLASEKVSSTKAETSTTITTTEAPQSIIAQIQESVANFLQASGISKTIEDIVANKTIVENKAILAATVAALSGIAAAVPLAANIPVSYSFGHLINSIFPFAGRRRKARYWGTVYDAENRQPLALAVVRIYSPETKKILQTQITDKDGRFNLLIASGEYYIEVIKEDYIFPSKMITSEYHGEIIKIIEGKVLELNIPLDPQLSKVVSRVKFIWSFKKILEMIYYPLMILGTVLAIIFYLKYRDLSNLLVLILYLFILIHEFLKTRRSRPFGLVFDKNNKTTLEMALVRVFDDRSGKLISTKVTDSKGKFVFLVNSGDYQLSAIKQGYRQFRSQTFKFPKSTLVNIDIALEKE